MPDIPEYQPDSKRESRNQADYRRQSTRPDDQAQKERYARDATTRVRVRADEPAKPRKRKGEFYRPAAHDRPHRGYAEPSRGTRRPQQRGGGFSMRSVAILAAVVAVVGIAIFAFVQMSPLTVTVNGVEKSLGGGKNIEEAVAQKFATPQPGNLIAVDGELLEEGQGEAYSAYVNGEQVFDMQAKLKNGDAVEITDGADTTETSQDTDEVVPFSVIEEGEGPIHMLEGTGVDGVTTTKIGEISGKTATIETAAPQNIVCRNYTPDVGTDPVIALTFSDGPWPESTAQILDLLAQYDAKATFFTIGKQCNASGAELVKRASDEGHQVCTQSFNYASGNGQPSEFAQLSTEEQIADIVKGRQALADATGKDVGTVVRVPGNEFDSATAKNLSGTITADIGWTIDTYDWRQFGTDGITENIASAQAGDIVLLHDGGGNRTQTIEALQAALPTLQAQGYRFITIDELMAYPPL